MSIALETVCEELELNLTDDPAARLVASKIIELAQRGVRGATLMPHGHLIKSVGGPSGLNQALNPFTSLGMASLCMTWLRQSTYPTPVAYRETNRGLTGWFAKRRRRSRIPVMAGFAKFHTPYRSSDFGPSVTAIQRHLGAVEKELEKIGRVVCRRRSAIRFPRSSAI